VVWFGGDVGAKKNGSISLMGNIQKLLRFKNLFTLLTWTANVQPGLQPLGREYREKILSGHVGTGTGGGGVFDDAQPAPGICAQAGALGTAVTGQRGHFGPCFSTEAAPFFNIRPAATFAFELISGGNRRCSMLMVVLATS